MCKGLCRGCMLYWTTFPDRFLRQVKQCSMIFLSMPENQSTCCDLYSVGATSQTRCLRVQLPQFTWEIEAQLTQISCACCIVISGRHPSALTAKQMFWMVVLPPESVFPKLGLDLMFSFWVIVTIWERSILFWKLVSKTVMFYSGLRSFQGCLRVIERVLPDGVWVN